MAKIFSFKIHKGAGIFKKIFLNKGTQHKKMI